MQTGTFETAVDPSDYMRRIATSPIGQAYKSTELRQLGLTAGASVLDLVAVQVLTSSPCRSGWQHGCGHRRRLQQGRCRRCPTPDGQSSPSPDPPLRGLHPLRDRPPGSQCSHRRQVAAPGLSRQPLGVGWSTISKATYRLSPEVRPMCSSISNRAPNMKPSFARYIQIGARTNHRTRSSDALARVNGFVS